MAELNDKLVIPNKFKLGTDTEVISASAPSGQVGIDKSTDQVGLSITSNKSYDLWVYDGSSWSFYTNVDPSNEEYDGGITFAWGNYTKVFFVTANASHTIRIVGIESSILVDTNPNDGLYDPDTLVTQNTSSGIGSIIANPSSGVDGAKGAKGDQGDQGDAGADSTVAGPQGLTGDQGIEGADGAQGATGAKGDQDPQGQQGEQG